MRAVACPIALHPDGAPRRIPAFQHPTAGLQLVKGGIKTGETPQAAAARELFEESGLETRNALFLGSSAAIQPEAEWHFSLCRIVPPVRAAWAHLCTDDGGHLFKFHWIELDDPIPDNMDPIFHNALAWIRENL
jgi:8-oxo-dGTP pyrophosphatase MutT (NUDIX family)